MNPTPFRHALAALALLMAAPCAWAGPVTYHLLGSFTGAATDKPEFVAAINPLLTGQALALDITLDPAAGASVSEAGGRYTLYRAITGSTARFAGFDTTSAACPSGAPGSSEFICTVQAHDGAGFQGGSVDPDGVSVFPAIAHSAAFDAATGLNRTLFLQFMMFVVDVPGQALGDEGLASALSSLTPGSVLGRLGVFALGADGFFSDRASFDFRLASIGTGDAAALPEPGSLTLALLALTGLGLRRHRATTPPRS